MKIELRAVKFFPSLSEETNCFQAAIYLDGKRIGEVENRGHGGCTSYSIPDAATRDRVEAHAKSLPPMDLDDGDGSGRYGTVPMNLEHLLDVLFEAWVKDREEKRFAKVAEKERVKNEAKGLPCTIEIRWADQMLWVGLKSQSDTERVFAAKKAKYKMGADAKCHVVAPMGDKV